MGNTQDAQDESKKNASKDATDTPKAAELPVSIDYGDQMRLYGEIELMLSTAANGFLMEQKEEGRLSVSSVKKVTKSWFEDGRPQVLEFRFDLATQLKLVQLNVETFHFFGPDGHDGMRQAVLFNCWRSVARELSIRTFCAPDSAVKKMMSECYRILEMLGTKTEYFLLLQHLQVKTLEKMNAAEKARIERKNMHGVTRQVHIP